MNKKPTETEKRMLTVIYDMTDGGAGGIGVDFDQIYERCEALGVFEMTQETFNTYKATVLERVKVLRGKAS